MDIAALLQESANTPFCLYGLGTETERFLAEYGRDLPVIGLLDGFREEGELYGYPIISLNTALEKGVKLILVIARPGSCKAITKRIGTWCIENEVALYDVRGRNLLEEKKVVYDFSAVQDGITAEELRNRIAAADAVSFDLFDTLVMRKVLSYTDLFELLEHRLREQGVVISEFAKLRLAAEKELSKACAPTLEEIYTEVLSHCNTLTCSAKWLAEQEWKLDMSLTVSKEEVCEVFREAVSLGKPVYITTDTYYGKAQIEALLDRFEICGYRKVLVSCEYGTAKTQQLFDILLSEAECGSVLHIGDDVYADVQCAEKKGIRACRIYSATDLFDALGSFGAEEYIISLADRVKTGLILSRLFRNPFWFETKERRVAVSDVYDVGYICCASMVTDFLFWMRRRMTETGIRQILFCARDGYLPKRLYRKIDTETKSVYFLTSRTAAIRAGMETLADISYVDDMKYFGSESEALSVRFGIRKAVLPEERNSLILSRAGELRENYRKYIAKQGLDGSDLVVFDFVAKGTTQLFLGKIFEQHLKGFYFLQPESEFMAKMGLDIEPFYTEREKDTSAIFDCYYILETILTSPEPSVEEFDTEGNPCYSAETRAERDIRCMERAQRGIADFFDEYCTILPETEWLENKRLDERFLSLVSCLEIKDEVFLRLNVEDPFFGRKTKLTDVI